MTYSKKDFLKKANKVHNNLYDYSDSVFINFSTKLNINCKEHGTFSQTPNNHINLKQGCPKCGVNRKRHSKITTNHFIQQVTQIHNNKYTYNKVIYVNAKKKVIITCPIHGDFEQTPNAHMNGQGCPKCGSYASSVSRLRDSTDFFKTCSDIHKDFYQYNKSIYTGIKHKITITCPIHGDFEQVAESHINEHKCPKCGVSYGGYNETFFELFPSYKQILGYLYFTELYYNDEQFYKLGITKRSPKIRTSNMVPYKIKNILTYAHIPLYDAFILEQQLLQTFKLFKYYPLYQFSGHTECFNLSTSNAKQFRDVIDTIKQNQYFSGHIE